MAMYRMSPLLLPFVQILFRSRSRFNHKSVSYTHLDVYKRQAQKLASDFGLDPKPPTAAAMAKPKRPYIRQFREDEMLCFRVLTDYLHLLEDWKVRYAPKTPEEALDDRFVEACQMHCPIEYMADVLTVGDLEERVALVDELMKEGKITFLQEYITRKKKEVAHHGEEPENA